MSSVLAPDSAWLALLERPAARVENERVDVCDLLLLGILTGAWERFTDGVRRGLALARDAPDAVTAADVRAAATAFRYARRLVSAAEFTTWLRERELTLDQLSAALARQVAEERERDDDGERADDAALAAVLRIEAYCRGALEALADAAIDRLAAADRLGGRAPGQPPLERVEAGLARALADGAAGLATLEEAELRRRLRRLVALDDALWQLREEIASPEAIDRCLAGHRLDWLQLRGEELALAELGAAREARLLVAEDGLTLAEVAERAGTVTRERSVYLEEVPEDATAAFAAAAPGEVIGPWLQEARWRVLVLREKVPPSAEDTVLTQRATDELLRGILERHRAGRSELLCVL